MGVLDDPSNEMGTAWGGKGVTVCCSEGSICVRSKGPEVMVGVVVSLTELFSGARMRVGRWGSRARTVSDKFGVA